MENKASRGEKTRQRILDAAEELFAEKDYSAARLEDVALAVGIKRASIVYYFAGKQELYEAVEQRIFSAMMAHTRRAERPDAPAMDQLLALLDGWLDFLVGRPTAARILLRISANSYSDSSAPVRNSFVALGAWEDIIRRGQASGEFPPASPAHLLHLLGAGTIYYTATGQLLGEERNYDPADSGQLEAFRNLMHRSARSLLSSP
ncbi:TetR/AcrR family transcriptional regulator [Parahaliea aestuarii]|uniref:TetR/AcrR family transcriptional regulator n=1 Tax=Parahaliea aestuarii TaxID=1852021 RepID=A0A5C9A4A5_9GAMM|nr:TetR/AcrR family transcriptional regulator [Parahaliea aestuarii]TXS94477.1 TetR/AcrR family transcriptional regulator [Parahaliea aestuarii]